MGRILILANNDIGLYKFRKELIKELLKDNEVFMSLPDGDYIVDLVNIGCIFINTKVDRRGINPVTDLKLILKYYEILRNVKPDLVITYTIKPNIYGGLISRMRNIKYAVNITGLGTAFQKDGILKRIITAMYKIALKKAKVVFFENEENRNVFVNNGIVSDKKAWKLNGAGVNLDEYPFVPYPEERNEIRFLFIGRVMREKGIYEFLEAARKIKLENKSIHFDIVGPKENEHIGKLEEFQNKGIINYYGYKKDVKLFIEKAHCFVLPSYHEGMANTLLECGAMGRPLIASDIPGCREALIDGKSGFLAKVGDANDLYIKIKYFIELPYIHKLDMANKSLEHIKYTFDKKKVLYDTLRELKF